MRNASRPNKKIQKDERASEVEQQLSNIRLRSTLDALIEGCQIISFGWRYLYVNPAAAHHGRRSPRELLGRTMMEIYPGIEQSPLFEQLRNCMITRLPGRIENEFTYPDGSTAFFELRIEPVAQGLCILSHDISERRSAKELLERSAALLARAQEIAQVTGFEITIRGNDPWSSETVWTIGTAPASNTITPIKYLDRVVHPADRAHVSDSIQKAFRRAARFETEYRALRPQGEIRYVHCVAEPTLDPSGKPVKYIGAIQDITERKELEREILHIIEREQHRIGQELHDGLCQHLAGIEFRLLRLRSGKRLRAKERSIEVERLARMIRDAIETTRTTAHGLSPVKIGADGLVTALRELATSVRETFKVSCVFNCPRPITIEENVVATHLYRIAQEAIQNAIRHGKPGNIVINLFAENNRIVLGVKDDGIGFPRKPRAGGMGLRVMQYRASMIQGSLVIEHGRRGGTEVICAIHFPVPQPAINQSGEISAPEIRAKRGSE